MSPLGAQDLISLLVLPTCFISLLHGGGHKKWPAEALEGTRTSVGQSGDSGSLCLAHCSHTVLLGPSSGLSSGPFPLLLAPPVGGGHA